MKHSIVKEYKDKGFTKIKYDSMVQFKAADNNGYSIEAHYADDEEILDVSLFKNRNNLLVSQ